MYRALLSACCRGDGASSMEGQYRRSKIRDDDTRLPSRSWVFNILKVPRHDHMLIKWKHVVKRSALQARRHGMLRKAVDAPSTSMNITFYGKVINGFYGKVINGFYAAKSKGKSGATRFNRLATPHCVVNGSRLTLGVEVVRKGESNADAVRRLLRICRRHRIAFSSITLDRGFYAADVINLLKKEGIGLVMPAVKRGKVKDRIKEHHDKKLGAISTHTITSKTGETASFTLAILRKEEQAADDGKAESGKKDAGIEGEYHVFATTTSDSWIGGGPKRVAEFYRRRWGKRTPTSATNR